MIIYTRFESDFSPIALSLIRMIGEGVVEGAVARVGVTETGAAVILNDGERGRCCVGATLTPSISFVRNRIQIFFFRRRCVCRGLECKCATLWCLPTTFGLRAFCISLPGRSTFPPVELAS